MDNTTNKMQSTLQVPHYYKKDAVGGVNSYQGLYIGKVMNIVDDRYEGYMYVDIIGHEKTGSPTTSKEEAQKYVRVRRLMPYGGTYQGSDHTRTFGMNCHPPAPGTEVLIAFTGSDQEGIMLGVLPDATRNGSVPDNVTAFLDDGTNTIGATFDSSIVKKQNKGERPRHPNSNFVAKQGLGLDSVRGLGSSGARRESPSNVFGFNTPMGHSFVMDDGTVKNSDACLAPDKDREEGLSNLCRWRSAGGAQILFNDTAGIVYVINQAGNCWLQMSNDGKIDLYSSGDISMHTENDFNLHVGGDFALDADSIIMKARGSDGCKIETATGEFNLHSNKDIKLTCDLNGHIKCAGFLRMTTDGILDLNGPTATASTKTTNNNITVNRSVKQSITGRVPEAEPWGGHAEEQVKIPSCASSDSNLLATDIDVTNIQNNTTTGASNQYTDPVPDVAGMILGQSQNQKYKDPAPDVAEMILSTDEEVEEFNTSIGGGEYYMNGRRMPGVGAKIDDSATQVGGYGRKSTNVNPRNGGPF